MSYKIDHIPRNTPNNRRPGHAMTAQYITIHTTANPTSTARNERNWLTNPSNTGTASYHIVIYERETIECLPLNEVGWHAGDGGSGPGNRTSIGIEICESGDYAKTLECAAELVADMLRARGWGVDRLRRHWDWPRPSDGYRKNCPRLMNADGKWSGWTEFVAKVAAVLQQTTIDEGGSEMKELQEQVKRLSEALATTRIPAPDWFVSEFGTADLGGLISEPTFTPEGWRVQATMLRAQGFGNGRGKSVEIR